MLKLRPFRHWLFVTLGTSAGLLAAAWGAGPVVGASDSNGTDEIVRLPPFVTSALRIDHKPWRYAKNGCFEILTRADDGDAGVIVDALQAGKALEDQVIPPEWLGEAPVSYELIIDDAPPDAATNSSIRTSPIKFGSPRDAVAWHAFATSVRLTNENFGAGDRDTFAINRNVYGSARGKLYGTITIERLGRSTPPLPIWLSTGLLGARSGVFREGFAFAEDEPGLVGPGLLWVSPAETRHLLEEIKSNRRRGLPTHVPMLSLADLFAERPPAVEGKRAVWESEAALLVHWALFGRGTSGRGRAGLVAFVERTRRAPATEAMFTECFGMSYAQMQGELNTYLADQLSKATKTTLARLPAPADVTAKSATSDQIGRILGDWLRMRAAYIEAKDPLMNYELLQAANRALSRAYADDNGLPPDVDPSPPDRTPAQAAVPNAGRVVKLRAMVVSAERIHDPALLAVYGMFEHQIGDDTKARELLEKAAKLNVSRPEAYRVLAQLRYDEALAQSKAVPRQLGAVQTQWILQPLDVCLNASPGSNAYSLLLDIWEHSETTPNQNDWARLKNAVSQFPRDIRLVYRVARLSARMGNTDDARAFCDHALLFVSDQSREPFDTLKAALPPAIAVKRSAEAR